MSTIRALNEVRGTIQEIHRGEVLAHVVMRVGRDVMVSIITRTQADALHLEIGDPVTIMIKATEVMILKP